MSKLENKNIRPTNMWWCRFRCCLYLANITFKTNFMYKKRTISKIIQLCFSLYATIFVWKALQKAHIADSVPLEVLITYTVISTIMSTVLPQNVISNIFSRDIGTGDISSKIIRPITFESFAIASVVGTSCAAFITKGVPVLILSILFFDLQIPISLVSAGMFFLSFFLAYSLFILIDFIAAYTCFWIIKGSNVQHFFETMITAFSGKIIPLFLLPMWFRKIADYLPMRLLYQDAILIFTGTILRSEFLFLLVKYLIWIIIVYIVVRVMRRQAYKRIFVQGG